MAKNGRTFLIFSDSITSKIQMPEFNRCIKEGHAYRKYFPGATPTELAHYCLPTLISDQPDTVIIHASTNSLIKDEVCKIATDLYKIVEICRDKHLHIGSDKSNCI